MEILSNFISEAKELWNEGLNKEPKLLYKKTVSVGLRAFGCLTIAYESVLSDSCWLFTILKGVLAIDAIIIGVNMSHNMKHPEEHRSPGNTLSAKFFSRILQTDTLKDEKSLVGKVLRIGRRVADGFDKLHCEKVR